MNAEFFAALDALETENGIPKNYMLEKIETALITAFKRDNNNNTNVKVYLDESKKEIKVYQLKDVVESGTVENPALQIELEDAKKVNHRYEIGDVAEIEFKPKDFGRISAQTAKQVIIQGIREHERGMLAKEYESKKEELISATVYKVDPVTGNAVLNIGKGEAVLNKTEQIPGEVLKEGKQIKVYVTEVKNQVKGPVINLSRKHQGFIKRLFELEVPEITDGTVIINAISREPGSRTKMAVSSSNKDVDPIGSCIGAKGVRINTILEEIKPEKVDIIKYSDDPVEYIKAALSPSTVIEVKVNTDERTCRVLVESNQLSLAIGKEGQNARLAAKLTGYKIDIKTPAAAAAAEQG
ncbi:MAG: transcription termination factor NusA [Oscillospiraceae bacterium]|nr:transcription termination factor NusA [Oscillospiraceae bacterium]